MSFSVSPPPRCHVGDIGVPLVAPAVTDLTGAAISIASATQLLIYLTRPDGVILVKTAALNTTGTDGLMKYVTAAGDMTVAGTWRMQGYAGAAGGFSGSGPEVAFEVFASRHG